MKLWVLAITWTVGVCTVHAGDLSGQIIIKRKLTKRSVTLAASSYHRGVTVAPPSDTSSDPLDYERSRVVIYVDGDLGTQPATVTMDQKGRRFLPDTLVVSVGSTVSFPNLDPIFHNVFSLSKPKSFDLGNYPRNTTRSVTFTKPGIVQVHCHLHPNMAASIIVTPNRWSTKAGANGEFNLHGLPPGTHTIVAWHKSAGSFRKTIRVTEGAPQHIEFHIPLEAEAVAQTR
jgi:plastocyanin